MLVAYIKQGTEDTVPMTTLINLPEFTLEQAKRYVLDDEEFGQADEVDTTKLRFGIVSFTIAQEKPWTYVSHTFVKMGG